MESGPQSGNISEALSGGAQEAVNLIEAVKKTLPVVYRDDGPPLGFEFDSVPIGKKADLLNVAKQKRMVIGDYDAHAAEDGSIYEIRKRLNLASGQKRKPLNLQSMDGNVIPSLQAQYMMGEGYLLNEKDLEREQKRREKKINREQERMNKEHQREIDRQQREHEKKLKQRQKEEERQKLQLERDMKKLERDMERERKAEERKKQQEVKRREKDLQKAFAAQVKVAQKAIQKELEAGPPDDLDLEFEALTKDKGDEEELIERPVFPPPSLQLESAFPELGNKVGGDIVMIWGFVQSFSDIISLPPFSINEFINALSSGQKSLLLSNIHIVLIRLIQADMEEAHHLVLTQGSGGTSNFMDRAVVGIAGTLDEAISWGFDVDAWRAHLNQFTWPEVLRQMAVSAGYGPKRSRGFKERRCNEDGEEVLEDSRAGYGLKMPSRLTQGTVKAAAWQVLSEVGPEGLTISEIATRIQKQGLRDLRTSKTPEATVAGALSRDAVFCRVAPATYALHAVLPSAENQSHHSSVLDGVDPSVKDGALDETDVDETEMDKCLHGEGWIQLLSNGDYNTLSLENKLEVLKSLCNMALESPTIRACLEARLEREIVEQKKLEIEAKAENRARREQAAEETQRRLMELETSGMAEAHENLDSTVKSMMTESMQTVMPNCLAIRAESSRAQDHIRLEPLGRDRRFNRYWSFNGGSCEVQDGAGHMFVELNGQFKILRSKEQLDALIESLEVRGAREGPLHFALTNYRENLTGEIPFWKESVSGNPERMSIDGCPSFDAVQLFARKWAQTNSLDMQLRKHNDWLDQLKTQLMNVERAVTPDGKPELDSIAWSRRLVDASSVEEVLTAMSQLEHALEPHILHRNYNKSPQILYGAWSDSYNPDNSDTPDGLLSWVPPSFAAAYFHLLRLDASLYYHPGMATGREVLLPYKYIQKPFVHELNPHIDASPVTQSVENASQTVSVAAVQPVGKLMCSSFPVLQKGTPVHKQSIPFSFPVDSVREAVLAAERNGTLYANIQLTKGRGRSGNRANNKGVKCMKRPLSELEDEMSTSGLVASSDDDPDVQDDDLDDETVDRSEISRDDSYV